MISIKRLYEFGASAVKDCPSLGSCEVVVSENELKDLMGEIREWPLLVCVIPSATGDDRGHDNIAEKNVGLFFVLKPITEGMTPAERSDIWAETQQGMKELKEYIHFQSRNNFIDIFGDADLGKREQEPEQNVADCSGWSLVFSYSTDGF